MKRVLFVGIVILLASSLGGIVCFAEEVFWDRDKSSDVTITDKDFKYKYQGARVKSFGDQEIYDTEKNQPDRQIPGRVYAPADDSVPIVPPVRPESLERQLERPRTTLPATRKTDVLPRQLDISPQPTASPDERPTAIKPPKELSRPRLQQVEKSTSKPAAEATQTPPLKKMKWGKDAAPAEQSVDDKPKFQWGK